MVQTVGTNSEGVYHLYPASANYAQARISEGLRVPFGWRAGVVDRGEQGGAAKLGWSAIDGPLAAEGRAFRLWLRLTTAVSMYEEKRVEVRLGQSGERIGLYDIRFSYALQPFEIELEPELYDRIMKEGVELELVHGSEPLWIVAEVDENNRTRLLQPHLLIISEQPSTAERTAAFMNSLESTASIQPFGWVEGCVLDGLLDLAQARRSIGEQQRWLDAADRHLRRFIDADGELFFENMRGMVADGTIPGIEDALMFAAIAKLWPGHKLNRQVIAFFESTKNAEGVIQDGGTLSAEGSYTIAYPLMVIAVRENRLDYAQEALRQLLVRKDRLVLGEDLYLRYHNGGNRTFRNWSRGYAWYMGGLVRTLIELDEASSAGGGDWTSLSESAEATALREEWRRIVGSALALREACGLWACFLGESGMGIETSGSAGIAAAIAMGARHKLNEAAEGIAAAAAAYEALQPYLTADGLLKGVTQTNRGGESLQRSGYRVISQMGMGLLGQLAAALETN
jgi:unsaturated rhamnogalacturonyl hydrolase